MSTRPWDVADPGRLVDEVAERVSLRWNSVHLAVVSDPSTDQRLEHLETLPTPAIIGHHRQVRGVLKTVTRDQLPIPPLPHEPVRHAVVTVIVRDGLTVLGDNERQWRTAWQFANHLRAAYTGALVLVTEHGWLDEASGIGGRTPRMVDPPPEWETTLPTARRATRGAQGSRATPSHW